MESFLKSINTLNEQYNDLYITYFLYRIWIKYKKLVIYTTSREDFNKILIKLNIQKEYHKLDIIYPLQNYMFYKDKNELDKLFLSNIVKIDEQLKEYSSTDPDMLEIKQLYDSFTMFINENNSVEDIDKILNQFRKKFNLQYRNIYIKDLVE